MESKTFDLKCVLRKTLSKSVKGTDSTTDVLTLVRKAPFD